MTDSLQKNERTNMLFLFSIGSNMYIFFKWLTLLLFIFVFEASLSSLLITPFPSPGSSLTSSCASSYQRRWLRSQTTSLENGVFPRWWDLDTPALKQCETNHVSAISMHGKTHCSAAFLGTYFQRHVQQCLSCWFVFPSLAMASLWLFKKSSS